MIPIVSSARALEIICKKWERLGYRPDAVVLEGPLAGGHLGFKADQIDLESNKLENLFPPVMDAAKKYGDIPVIVAGGIYTHADIVRFLKMGASGVQMGTRFLATEESTASEEYKRAVIAAKEEDIIIAIDPGSPCGLPFRVIRQSADVCSRQSKDSESRNVIRAMCSSKMRRANFHACLPRRATNTISASATAS